MFACLERIGHDLDDIPDSLSLALFFPSLTSPPGARKPREDHSLPLGRSSPGSSFLRISLVSPPCPTLNPPLYVMIFVGMAFCLPEDLSPACSDIFAAYRAQTMKATKEDTRYLSALRPGTGAVNLKHRPDYHSTRHARHHQHSSALTSICISALYQSSHGRE